MVNVLVINADMVPVPSCWLQHHPKHKHSRQVQQEELNRCLKVEQADHHQGGASVQVHVNRCCFPPIIRTSVLAAAIPAGAIVTANCAAQAYCAGQLLMRRWSPMLQLALVGAVAIELPGTAFTPLQQWLVSCGAGTGRKMQTN